MEKPSVTIFHREGYAAGGAFFGGAVFVAFLNTVMPSARQDERILGYAIAAMAAVLAVVSFLWARCAETIDEHGICIRGVFAVKRYAWDAVKRVGIIPPLGKDLPKIEIRISDKWSPLLIDYTRRSLECVRCYYGTPDYDKWGKPPTVS